jgi:hypothetical protein
MSQQSGACPRHPRASLHVTRKRSEGVQARTADRFDGSLWRYARHVANESHIGHSDPLALVYMLIVFAAALLVPTLVTRFSRGSSDSDGDGGDGRGGGGPRRPPPEKPGPPSGGLPLDQSQAARIRFRDGRRLGQRLPVPARRPVREPARRPARTAPMNRCPTGSHRPPRCPRSPAGRARACAPRPTRRTSPGPSASPRAKTRSALPLQSTPRPGEWLRADE